MKRVARAKTRFQQVDVWKSKDEVEFRCEGAVHAWYHRTRHLTGLAWDMIACAALLGAVHPPRSVLMLGLAGGTAFRTLRRLLPDCELTAVDIDPEIVQLAREHMHLDELGAEVIIDDAYQWLRGSRRRFDVVIDDIYLAGHDDVFRPRHCDPVMIRDLRRAMHRKGVLALNLVTGTGHRRMQSSTRSCLRDEFPLVRSLGSPMAQNEVLVAGTEVAGRSRWMEYVDCFDHPADRELWRGMHQRRI